MYESPDNGKTNEHFAGFDLPPKNILHIKY